jgi:hypothetical protein
MPRLSITDLIAGLLIGAADLGWFRWFVIDGRRSLFGLYPMALDLGIIPIASILAMSAYLIASHRKRSSPFLVGFTIFLSMSLLSYSACCLIVPSRIDTALQGMESFLNGLSITSSCRRILEPVGAFIFSNRAHFDLFEISSFTVILSLPQVILALSGGLLARKLHNVGET